MRVVRLLCHLFAVRVAVAVDRADADESLVVVERLVAALAFEDELQSVECAPRVRAVSAAQRLYAGRNVHNCVPTDTDRLITYHSIAALWVVLISCPSCVG